MDELLGRVVEYPEPIDREPSVEHLHAPGHAGLLDVEENGELLRSVKARGIPAPTHRGEGRLANLGVLTQKLRESVSKLKVIYWL